MTDLIRITPHPTDPHLLHIHTSPTLAGIMGQLPEARYIPTLKAYLLHLDALPGLRALAQHHHLHVLDQTPSTGPTPTPQECAHCAHPEPWAKPPTYCPGCGHTWQPTPPPTHRLDTHWPACPDCGHRQRTSTNHCTECGTTLDLSVSVPETPAPTPSTERPRLEEPQPLDHLLAAYLDDATVRDNTHD